VTNKIGSGGIENRPAQVGSDRTVKKAPGGPPQAAPAVEVAKQGAGVQITDSARQLAALEQAIRAMPDVDEGRVQTIRAAIADGSYKVQPDRIAEKLMRIEGELR